MPTEIDAALRERLDAMRPYVLPVLRDAGCMCHIYLPGLKCCRCKAIEGMEAIHAAVAAAEAVSKGGG